MLIRMFKIFHTQLQAVRGNIHTLSRFQPQHLNTEKMKGHLISIIFHGSQLAHFLYDISQYEEE